jgi:hypothetical protein
MAERDAEASPGTVRIRNVTRTSLSFQVPGQSIRLMPGQTVDVHKAFLETTELQALCQQGSVRQAEPEAPARPAADEGEKEPGGEPGRRPATRRR